MNTRSARLSWTSGRTTLTQWPKIASPVANSSPKTSTASPEQDDRARDRRARCSRRRRHASSDRARASHAVRPAARRSRPRTCPSTLRAGGERGRDQHDRDHQAEHREPLRVASRDHDGEAERQHRARPREGTAPVAGQHEHQHTRGDQHQRGPSPRSLSGRVSAGEHADAQAGEQYPATRRDVPVGPERAERVVDQEPEPAVRGATGAATGRHGRRLGRSGGRVSWACPLGRCGAAARPGSGHRSPRAPGRRP